jgi:L-alanine-DL-glutamate epimerase-like enolase superfamily enzyme
MSARISKARAWLVDIPVETVRTDAMQAFLKQETIFVEVSTDDGASGLGYSYTIGTGGSSVLALLNDHLLPELLGQDADRVEAVWRRLFDATRATAVGAITSLALAAVDTALWDRRSRVCGLPLHVVAGGARTQVPIYDTEIGWLHLPIEDVAAGAAKVVAAGAKGVKIKIGKPSPQEDAERLRAVRAAIGPHRDLMVDANQAFTLVEALRRTSSLEEVDALWFEEPLPADDVAGHERLARHTSVAIAVGESMYSITQFAEYLARGAAGIVQVDVARIGGITPWLKVAHAAEAHNVQVCPHFLMELHVSLSAAVPNGRYVEYIPQLRSVTRSELTIIDGEALAPTTPGLGIDWDFDALDKHRVG